MTLNPLPYLQNLLIEKFFKSYLKGFFDRLKGYTFFTGLILTILQISAFFLAGNPQAMSVLQFLINSFSDVTTGVLQPSDITVVATSLLTIWGLIMKLVKLFQGKPQVPTIISKKADL